MECGECTSYCGIIVADTMLQISGEWSMTKIFGLAGLFFSSINVIGGFVVTHKVLSMFKKIKVNNIVCVH